MKINKLNSDLKQHRIITKAVMNKTNYVRSGERYFLPCHKDLSSCWRIWENMQYIHTAGWIKQSITFLITSANLITKLLILFQLLKVTLKDLIDNIKHKLREMHNKNVNDWKNISWICSITYTHQIDVMQNKHLWLSLSQTSWFISTVTHHAQYY